LLGALLVCPPWFWLAVGTDQCLRFLTRQSVPFTKRTVWLIKILALMSARKCSGNSSRPWHSLVSGDRYGRHNHFFSVRESASEVVPPTPRPDPPAYQPAWQEYWHLRHVYTRQDWVSLLRSYCSSRPFPPSQTHGCDRGHKSNRKSLQFKLLALKNLPIEISKQ